MPSIAANAIYPPLPLSAWRMITACAALAVAVGGYYLINFARKRLALRRQKQLAQLHKPHKDDYIRRALQEIERVKTAVANQQVTPSNGAADISLAVRNCYDTLMNHTTTYQARYEVAERQLQTMLQMLTIAYPTEFTNKPSQLADFNALCDQAVTVVQSCN